MDNKPSLKMFEGIGFTEVCIGRFKMQICTINIDMWKLLRKLCLKNIIAIFILFNFLELLYQYSKFIEDFSSL